MWAAAVSAIDGMPGVGKTALAIRAAHELAPRFPDGQYFVYLHAHTPGQQVADPSEVLAGLLTDLGIDPRRLPDTLAARRDLWRDRTAGKRVLLVLDDTEGPAQIEPLLPTGSGCMTIVTSRRRLVALDGATPLSLDVLDPDSAASLFITLGRRSITDAAERAALERIVRLCGYLPLAIVLLAGRLAHHDAWRVTGLAEIFAAASDRISVADAQQGQPGATRAESSQKFGRFCTQRNGALRCGKLSGSIRSSVRVTWWPSSSPVSTALSGAGC